MSVMIKANFDRLLKKDLSKLHFQHYGAKPSMIPALYAVTKPDQTIVTHQMFSDIGNASEWDGQIYYSDTEQTYTKTLQEIRYSLGVIVDEPLMRGDMYGAVKKMIKQIATGMRRARDGKASTPFSGAFSDFLTADGLSLCNSAHTSSAGGSNQSNTGTTAFSPAAVEAVRQLMVAFRTDKDHIIDDISPTMLLVGTDNFLKAWEFLNSSGKIDTANNNKNYYSNGMFELVVWDNYITGGDWFFIDKSKMKDNLYWYEWKPTTFIETDDFDTQAYKYASICAINNCAIDWRWVYGNNPA